MKCPHCGNRIPPRSTTCKYCKVRIAKKSTKMARRMSMNARIATISGGVLVLMAIVLAIYHTFIFAGITLVVGAILMFIGKMMD